MKTLGIIDIGTNSIRLAVEHMDSKHASNTLAFHKEVVRLGEGEFAHNKLTKPAMNRGILVLRNFVDIARRYDASEIVAVATAAVREAQNRAEFVKRVREECGVDIKVISGLEEARLIYLGVVNGVDLNSSRGLFIDIGGGTTELITGDCRDHTFLESVKLGAIRLSEIFLEGRTGKISKKRYTKMLDYVRGAVNHAAQQVRAQGFDVMFGSSGTIMNLGEITARRVESNLTTLRNYCMSYKDLKDTIDILCNLSVEDRRNVPGINPERADIIVSGAAILDAITEEVGAGCIRISDRALRDGVLIDHLFQEDRVREEYLTTSARQRSILQLARSCSYEENHAAKVTELAGSIYQQIGSLGLHQFDDTENELLRYTAIVHDVGTFISHGDHHKHSYYLIRNWNLLGFDDEEVEIIATAAMAHRKISPKKAANGKLSAAARKQVEVMSAVLRIADSLDRSHLGLVNEVICRMQPGQDRVVMEIHASEDCPLEMWAFENKKSLFEEVFGVDVSIKRIVV